MKILIVEDEELAVKKNYRKHFRDWRWNRKITGITDSIKNNGGMAAGKSSPRSYPYGY